MTEEGHSYNPLSTKKPCGGGLKVGFKSFYSRSLLIIVPVYNSEIPRQNVAEYFNDPITILKFD